MCKVYVYCPFHKIYNNLRLQQNSPNLPLGNHGNTLYQLQLVSHTNTGTYSSSWYI